MLSKLQSCFKRIFIGKSPLFKTFTPAENLSLHSVKYLYDWHVYVLDVYIPTYLPKYVKKVWWFDIPNIVYVYVLIYWNTLFCSLRNQLFLWPTSGFLNYILTISFKQKGTLWLHLGSAVAFEKRTVEIGILFSVDAFLLWIPGSVEIGYGFATLS